MTLSYDDVIYLYGSDSPDLRYHGRLFQSAAMVESGLRSPEVMLLILLS